MSSLFDARQLEVDRLVAELIDETLSEEGFARLQELLRGSAALRDHYIESMSLYSDLCEAAALSMGADDRPGDLAHPEVLPAAISVHGSNPRQSRLAWTVAAAACLAALLAGALAVRSRPGGGERSRRESAAGTADPSPMVPVMLPGDRDARAIATLVRVEAARWHDGDGPRPEVGDVLTSRRLRLLGGRAVLAFISGVMLTFEGPIDLDLVAGDRIFCRRGRLRARVPTGAEGFVVAMPGSAVVDLGTEFAMNVDPDGRAHVMVFEGMAEAALLDPLGSPKRTQMVERSEAFDLDPRAGRIAEAVARPDAFVSTFDAAMTPLRLDPAYPDAVLQAKPRGYWRFEALAKESVPNEVPGGPPLRVHGPIAIGGGRGNGNGYAGFQPGVPGQFLDASTLWLLPGAPGHAVEVWFQSDRFSRASLVGLYPPVDQVPAGAYWKCPHNLLLETSARERHSLFRPASIRFLHRWPLDSRVGDNICSEANYVPRRWHHVVAQKNGSRMELYVDGVAQWLPLEPDHPSAPCYLVVGRRTIDLTETNDPRSFVGRLDELAIYDHPLSAEQIRRHFQLAGQ